MATRAALACWHATWLTGRAPCGLASDSFTGGRGKAVTIPFSQELVNAIRALLAAKRFDLNPR